MTLPEPIALPNESLKALQAFKVYIELGDKRSVPAVAGRLQKSVGLIARWCRKHHWRKRITEMTAMAAAEENERNAEADLLAKQETALLIERERLRFVRRQIAASERATEVAMQILNSPHLNCTPPEASRLLAVANSIGGSALGIPSSHALEVSGIGASPVNITMAMSYDAQSFRNDEIQKQFLLENPTHPQAQRVLREIEERQAGWLAHNGSNGE
jgi:hypothetical protein